MGITVLYLSLIVLIPLATLPAQALSMSWAAFRDTITDPRVVASYRLSLGASLGAAAINAVFGFAVAWTLARYSFPGRRIVDALIDLPFALPTAVAGIVLTTLYAPNGWLGEPLARHGITVAFTPLGVTVALIFSPSSKISIRKSRKRRPVSAHRARWCSCGSCCRMSFRRG
jgi:sulfate transport system permease protein